MTLHANLGEVYRECLLAIRRKSITAQSYHTLAWMRIHCSCVMQMKSVPGRSAKDHTREAKLLHGNTSAPLGTTLVFQLRVSKTLDCCLLKLAAGFPVHVFGSAIGRCLL